MHLLKTILTAVSILNLSHIQVSACFEKLVEAGPDPESTEYADSFVVKSDLSLIKVMYPIETQYSLP